MTKKIKWAYRHKMSPSYQHILFSLLVLALLVPLPALPNNRDHQSAVILVYHRIGDPRHPTTQINTELFAQHARMLAEGDYNVLDLADIIDAWRTGTPLPERSVAITIDDAYASFFDHGWPILRQYRLPFTLFVATDPVDDGYADYMTWNHIRILAQSSLARIGNHSATHQHLPRLEKEEKIADILHAHQRLEEETGITPTLYSYPYGEFDADSQSLLEEKGYHAAFGQYSSVADGHDDRFYKPRFPINQHYGDQNRMRLITNALPLPIHVIKGITNHEKLASSRRILLQQKITTKNPITCYASHGLDIRRTENDALELLFVKPLPTGTRFSLNCTAPEVIKKQKYPHTRWRWWGRSLLCCEPSPHHSP